jgi:hypothetical protein
MLPVPSWQVKHVAHAPSRGSTRMSCNALWQFLQLCGKVGPGVAAVPVPGERKNNRQTAKIENNNLNNLKV